MKRLAALAVFAVVLTGACAKKEAASPTAAPPVPATTSQASMRSTLAVNDSSHGKILTDGKGATLYVFLKDTGSKSSCTDTCASTWPALVADNPTASAGVDKTLIGTITGSNQVTYNGRPLYHFSGDTKVGDTNGQGIGGFWYVVSPAGEPIKT